MPNVMSGLEEIGPKDSFYKYYTASQACDSGKLLIKDSSPDKASSKL